MAAPDAARALYGGEGKCALPRSPGGGPLLLALPPPDAARGHAPLSRVLASRRSARDFDAKSRLSLAEAGELLWAAQGVTQPPEAPSAAPKGRTAPSAGALFPLELFLIAGENTIEGLGAGVWWYRPEAHDLQRLRNWPGVRAALAADDATAQQWLAAAPAVLVLAAAVERSQSRFGPARGERYALMEAGCSVQNSLLMAEALQLGAVWVGAFHDQGVANALGLPPALRPLAVIPVGRVAPPGAPHEGEKQHEVMMRAAAAAAEEAAKQPRRVPVRDTEHDID